MLGERLVKLRKEKKLTQADIAKRLHLTRSTYAQYEVDRRVPEYVTLQKLADFFDVSIDYLVGRTDDRKPTSVNRITNVQAESAVNNPKYSRLPPEKKKLIDDMIDALSDE